MTKLSDWAAEYASAGVVRITRGKSETVDFAPLIYVPLEDVTLEFVPLNYVPLEDADVTIVDPEDDPDAWRVARVAFGVLGYDARVYAVAVAADQSGTVYAC